MNNSHPDTRPINHGSTVNNHSPHHVACNSEPSDPSGDELREEMEAMGSVFLEEDGEEADDENLHPEQFELLYGEDSGSEIDASLREYERDDML